MDDWSEEKLVAYVEELVVMILTIFPFVTSWIMKVRTQHKSHQNQDKNIRIQPSSLGFFFYVKNLGMILDPKLN